MSNSIIAQLKMKNIQSKPIKAIKVKLALKDTVGNALKDEVVYDYLDLNAQRDADFGQKSAIIIPNNSARAYCVEVLEVAFSDNTVWENNGAAWTQLSTSTTIEEACDDAELTKQYKLRYGNKCVYLPIKECDVWRCSCGAINRDDEETCHLCGNSAKDLFSCDFSELKKEADLRVEQEAKTAQEGKKKKVKILSIALLALSVIAVILYAGVLNPSAKRQKAREICERGIDSGISNAWSEIGFYFDESKEEFCKTKQVSYDTMNIQGNSFSCSGSAVLTGHSWLVDKTYYLTLYFECEGDIKAGTGNFHVTNTEIDYK